jgi:argininosuccinate lyase
MKMWSGRFRQPLDPAFESWQRSFDFDHRLLKYELQASSAHARDLEKTGVLSAEELAAVLQGLKQIGKQAASSPEFLNDPEVEDVHHFVEKQLVKFAGDVGYKLHSGRSRNEQIATDLRLYVAVGCDEIDDALAALVGVFRSRRAGGNGGDAGVYAHAAR